MTGVGFGWSEQENELGSFEVGDVSEQENELDSFEVGDVPGPFGKLINTNSESHKAKMRRDLRHRHPWLVRKSGRGKSSKDRGACQSRKSTREKNGKDRWARQNSNSTRRKESKHFGALEGSW